MVALNKWTYIFVNDKGPFRWGEWSAAQTQDTAPVKAALKADGACQRERQDRQIPHCESCDKIGADPYSVGWGYDWLCGRCARKQGW